MNNIPEVKIGIVGVSRDCFPAELTLRRRAAVAAAYQKKYDAESLYECPVTIIESEIDMMNALEDVKAAGCNALCVYLGNFGPEISETLLARYFDGPVMFCAAAEETQEDLFGGRGDAFCGMLNASYNLNLRNVRAYIPDEPCGDAEECADMIRGFLPIARVALGLRDLKIISFGPRPANFMACNAPIKPLFDLGVEIEEESELDLFEAYQKHEGDARIPEVAADMAEEMGYAPGQEPDMLPKLAQYELTLLDWAQEHKGCRKYVALTTKCWPAFQDMFHFVPCYVNSRLMQRGIPVSCEVDIYGTLSEYIGLCLSEEEVTLLDINNTVPRDMYQESIRGKCSYDYAKSDTFMGFHCGNTCSTRLCSPHLSYQRIMANTHPQEWCDGTIEGDIQPGPVTFYRLQATAEGSLIAYAAEGEVLPVATRSFGSIGVFAISQFGRFYRHWLIEKNFPHHGAVMFGHYGKVLYDTLKFIGIAPSEIGFNRPEGDRYEGENPFER